MLCVMFLVYWLLSVYILYIYHYIQLVSIVNILFQISCVNGMDSLFVYAAIYNVYVVILGRIC